MYLLALVFLLSILANAQQRIGVVNGYLFSDEKVGIRKLAESVAFLNYSHNGCTYACGPLTEKIKTLAKEIEVLKVASASIQEKEKELSDTKQQLKRIQEDDRARYEKLFAMLIEPIMNEINAKLISFSKQKGYTKLFDISDDKVAEAVLYIDESIDVTKEFIQFCNEEFEKVKIQK